VIDALVDHFTSFPPGYRQLPVVWHLCLLTAFVALQARSAMMRSLAVNAYREAGEIQHNEALIELWKV
jgi:hypothetical protein